MNNEETLIKEVQEDMKVDLEKRQASLQRCQEADHELQQRMASGEIGLSHGADHYVSVLMFAAAAVFTLLALYFVFAINPAHYQI